MRVKLLDNQTIGFNAFTSTDVNISDRASRMLPYRMNCSTGRPSSWSMAEAAASASGLFMVELGASTIRRIPCCRQSPTILSVQMKSAGLSNPVYATSPNAATSLGGRLPIINDTREITMAAIYSVCLTSSPSAIRWTCKSSLRPRMIKGAAPTATPRRAPITSLFCDTTCSAMPTHSLIVSFEHPVRINCPEPGRTVQQWTSKGMAWRRFRRDKPTPTFISPSNSLSHPLRTSSVYCSKPALGKCHIAGD